MSKTEFSVSFPETLCKDPIDGRVLLAISNDESSEPRFQISNYPSTQQLIGTDIDNLKPGEEAILDDNDFGYPVESISNIPAGRYLVQAVIHRYETFNRSDKHVVKLHMDQGEGHKWNRAPGNLYSTPKWVKFDPKKKKTINILRS